MTFDLPRPRASALLLLALLGAVAHYFFGYSHFDLSGHAWGSDDAFISYRYARQLVEGHGLVFNPGERVEGYTNLLYTLIAAGFVWLDPEAVYIGCFVVNLLAYVGVLVVCHAHLTKKVGSARALTGLALLCASPLMWAWPASGLESSCVLFVQFALFVVADTASVSPSRRLHLLFGALATTAILLRADGFVFAVLATAPFLLRRRYRALAGALLLIAALTVACFVARYGYYGDILPNTYYAKVSGTLGQRLRAGWKQLRDLIHNDAFILYLLPLLAVPRALARLTRPSRMMEPDDVSAIPFVTLALTAYWLYIGGDVYYERFLLVLIPMGIVHFAASIRAQRFSLLALVFLALQLLPLKRDARFDYHRVKFDRWVALGRYLAQHEAGRTLAIDAAGKVPYYAGLRTIDMLGLNDRHIGHRPASFFQVGHNKFDPDYVFSRHPDLIAAWGFENLDVRWGITRAQYIAHGYKLKYVVNSTPQGKAVDIVDVDGFDTDRIQNLFRDGYRYFVVARETPQ